MRYLGQVLPAASVPEVLAHDDEAYLFAMSHAPDGGVNWKDALLRGDIDLAGGGAGRRAARARSTAVRPATPAWPATSPT